MNIIGMRGLKGFMGMAAVAAGLLVMGAAGCGSEKKAEAPKKDDKAASAKQPAMSTPSDDMLKASHANIKTQKQVSISDEVRARWKEAGIEITDNASGKTGALTIKVGSDVKLTDDNVRLKVDTLVPDYAIADSRIESRSNEPNNPAVLVELTHEGKTITRGWIFRDYPEFNSFNDKRFKLKLTSPAAAATAKK